MEDLVTLKDRVLELNQEYIFAIYFNISIEDINWATQYSANKLLNSLRGDTTPSLSFKWYGSRLFARDWANFNYNGDIFKVIGYIINKNSNNPDDFVYICNDILDRYLNRNYKGIKKLESQLKDIDEKSITTISCVNRILNKNDYFYFNQYGILNKQVDKYVNAVSRFSLNGIQTGYRNSRLDPCYEYIVNRDFRKLYFPYRNRSSSLPRFLTNNILSIDDLHTIRYYKDIILIKAIKDKMLLEQFLDNLGLKDIGLLTVSSESNLLHPSIVNIINKNVKYNVFSMFDIDTVGLNQMNHFRDTYGYRPLYFSTKAKDPTDFTKSFGYQQGLQIFKESVATIINNRNRKLLKVL